MSVTEEDAVERQNNSTWKEVKATPVHWMQSAMVISVLMIIGGLVGDLRGLAIGAAIGDY